MVIIPHREDFARDARMHVSGEMRFRFADLFSKKNVLPLLDQRNGGASEMLQERDDHLFWRRKRHKRLVFSRLFVFGRMHSTRERRFLHREKTFIIKNKEVLSNRLY